MSNHKWDVGRAEFQGHVKAEQQNDNLLYLGFAAMLVCRRK